MSVWKMPVESWKESKLVGPPGPSYRIALPCLIAATPWAKEYTVTAPGPPSPILAMNGAYTLGEVDLASTIASADRLIASYRCTAPGAVR